MSEDECFIKPQFSGVKSRRRNRTRSKRQTEVPKPEPVEQLDPEPEVESGSVQSWSPGNFVRDHKMIIITVAVIITILICLFIYFNMRNEAEVPGPGPGAMIMAQQLGRPPAQPIPQPTQQVQPTPWTNPQPPGLLAQHDKIVNTVDDKELDKYLSPDDKELNSYINAEDKSAEDDKVQLQDSGIQSGQIKSIEETNQELIDSIDDRITDES